MNTVSPPLYEWKAIPWRKVERTVFKLQKRIFQAQQRGHVKAVRKLQRLLVCSWSAKCLAVRRVTQDNRGKHTAGVDGVKSLPPSQRLALVRTIRLSRKAQPTRRVWIPKPGTDEQRPLGIPTMHDRAAQALLLLALEPSWEAQFEPNSYGFRPGRSAHDAIVAIWNGLNRKPKFVLDADIAKCFDRINHEALLHKLNTTPTFRHVVQAWLKAGVMDGPELFPTEAGTPQGGVVSPLLANIALHSLETAIKAAFPRSTSRYGKMHEEWTPTVVRYADDFVVMHRDLPTIERAQQVIAEWLVTMGLELKPSKTRIVHSLREHAGQPPGFDFLGFEVRQFPVGKTHAKLGFKTIVKPSKAARRRHGEQLQQALRQARTSPQAAVIGRLNPVIRGWSNYYATVNSKRVFSLEDHNVVRRLLSWAKRRHSNKPMNWVVRKYWRLEAGQWDFATKEGVRLARHSHRPIQWHIKVQGNKSHYDGDWSYWATRTGRHPELPKRVATLLRKQQGRCVRCRLHFQPEDSWEVDRLIPVAQGGKDEYANWQLLHKHCHDQKRAEDDSLAWVPMTTGHTIEEPDEGKLSRPVLKTSRPGDRPA